MKRARPSTSITVEVNGTTYAGHYRVEGDVVTVTTTFWSKSTQAGGSSAEAVARMLLYDLIDEQNAWIEGRRNGALVVFAASKLLRARAR